MPIDYGVLKDEILKDPQSLGYAAAGVKGNDGAVAVLLNNISASFPVNREPVSAAQIFSNIDPDDFGKLDTLQLQQLQCVLAAGFIDLNDPRMQQIVFGIFGGSVTSKSLLTSFQTRSGSRAEVLFGRGTVIAPADVSKALGRG